MKLIKPIIAVFLLLTYSFAFAVELIPHCHFDNHINYTDVKNGETHQHSNHRHVEIENKDSDDVFHENHLDDSVLDFVICFLSEIEHHESDIFHQHLIVSQLNTDNYKSLSKTKIIAVLFAVFVEPSIVESHQEFNTAFIDEYQLSLIKSSPHRGPPSFSC